MIDGDSDGNNVGLDVDGNWDGNSDGDSDGELVGDNVIVVGAPNTDGCALVVGATDGDGDG